MRAPDASGLGRDLRLAGMARALENVPKLADPHMRRVALARAGYRDSTVRDEHDALAVLDAKRRALAGSIGSLAA